MLLRLVRPIIKKQLEYQNLRLFLLWDHWVINDPNTSQHHYNRLYCVLKASLTRYICILLCLVTKIINKKLKYRTLRFSCSVTIYDPKFKFLIKRKIRFHHKFCYVISVNGLPLNIIVVGF